MARYCVKCGPLLSDNNNFCTKCGSSMVKDNSNETNNKPTNVYAIIGLVCAFLVGPVFGTIFSIIGLIKAKEMNDEGKTLAIIGLVISGIKFVCVIFLIITTIIRMLYMY